MFKVKKAYLCWLVSIFMTLMLSVTCFASEGVEKEMRGVWVATVYGLDYPSSGATINEVKLKEDAITVLNNALEMGFNTIFLQVRPSGDALYKSDIFPWSKYLTGEQGKAPENNFDPLAFWIEEAHKRGLELHAWLNPYRITASKNDNGSLAPTNPAVLFPELTVVHPGDGKLYYNPGVPETRELILRGIEEIIEGYDVDGIHLDDYFYPAESTIGQFGDLDTFATYGEGFESIEDWRRNNNDLLIQSIHELVESKSDTVVFGVSPAGIWANKKDHPEGSETAGSQTYFKAYADTKGWVEKGYLDYILPQIYWEIGLPIADYEILVKWWSDVARDTDVALYIGQAAYKTVENVKPGGPWEENQGVNEIHRQLIMNETIDNISGYSMYAYNTFLKNDALRDFITKYQREMKGVWVATVWGLDYPASGATTKEEILKQDAITVLDNAKKMGFNTVFLQVRPSGDAFYQSSIFPWSKYLTGEQGKAPENGFDPLKFWVEEAHKRDLELHAWLNPYRVTASSGDNDKLAPNNPAVLNPELTLLHPKDGKLYYNPGMPETRELIIRGIEEIVNRYDVDGIHLDDYFYPAEDRVGQFGDQETFEQYGNGFTSIQDWRRNNNDLLVKGIYDAVKSVNKDVVFGVSPAGIWANKKDHPEGSETAGNQTYFTAYADTKGWVEKGYLDYILPQIYWNIGFQIADYQILVDWWSDVIKDTPVKLYIGQGAYRTVDVTDPNSPWYGERGIQEIHNQLKLNKATMNVSGYSMYAYNSFFKNPDLYDFIVAYHYPNGGIDAGQLPVVTEVSFGGEAVVGETLSATYKYKDPFNRPETTTIYNWYISGETEGSWILLEGEHAKSLMVKTEYRGKKVKVEVIPGNDEVQGKPVEGHNGRNQIIGLGDVDKDGYVTYKDALTLQQYVTGITTLDPQAQVAGNMDGIVELEINDVKELLSLVVGNEE